MTTFSDNSSVDHQIENVYKQAANLFDTRSVLDIEKDEYARGVVELVMMLLGMDSDDKEEIANIISESTGTYRVTRKDFGTGINGDLLYIGPFDLAREYIKRECSFTVKWEDDKKAYRVELDEGNCFGVADTLEMAWRYAIAAELVGNDLDYFEPVLLK